MAEGTAVVLHEPFSFLGGVNPVTGTLTLEGDDRKVAGRILVFPRGKGSTVGSYVILDMMVKRTLPLAMINQEAEPIVATGAVMASVPLIDKVDISMIRDGDWVKVDGGSGTVEMPEITEVDVVTSILMSGDRILLLHRSAKVGSFIGKWAGVSGYVEGNETPAQCAIKEIEEETGVADPVLEIEGKPIRIRNGERVWRIHPFLFRLADEEIVIDWEHDEYRWIKPGEARELDTVPGLERILGSLGLL